MADTAKSHDPWDSIPPAGEPAPRAVAIAVESASLTAGDRERRQHDRVAGPFDGCRLDLLATPVRMFDLSVGGCFVNSLHEQREGTSFVLKIDLPQEGWITVNVETIYRRPGFGFAVRFVDLDAETEACLIRTIDTLKEQQANR